MNEVPSTWELVSLKRVSEIKTGLTLGKEYEGPLIDLPQDRHPSISSMPLHGAGHQQRGIGSRPRRYREETPGGGDHPGPPAVLPDAGDVLMTEGGDLDKLGRGTIWNGEILDCLHQNHMFRG
jgi:type I restriction enzyme S subunit